MRRHKKNSTKRRLNARVGARRISKERIAFIKKAFDGRKCYAYNLENELSGEDCPAEEAMEELYLFSHSRVYCYRDGKYVVEIHPMRWYELIA